MSLPQFCSQRSPTASQDCATSGQRGDPGELVNRAKDALSWTVKMVKGVERSFAWFARSRRLVRRNACPTETTEAWLYLARPTLRRLGSAS